MIDIQADRQLAVVAIITVIIVFVMFHLLTQVVLTRQKGKTEVKEKRLTVPVLFFTIKASGFLLTGLIPFILFRFFLNLSPADSGFTSGRWVEFLLPTLILVILTLASTFSSSRSPSIWERVPELKVKSWNIRLAVSTSLAWILYLFGYEYLFRGILWFTTYDAFGFFPALVVNLVLYSAAHLPQGKLMVIGSIPVGVIFCTLSYFTGSFLPAFLIHSVLACSTETFVIINNPAIGFRK
jgi:membrane protease YdiL (CAAX protease family)